jgi:hypothetical protein
MLSPITTALSQRKPASAGTCGYSYRTPVHDKTDFLSTCTNVRYVRFKLIKIIRTLWNKFLLVTRRVKYSAVIYVVSMFTFRDCSAVCVSVVCTELSWMFL